VTRAAANYGCAAVAPKPSVDAEVGDGRVAREEEVVGAHSHRFIVCAGVERDQLVASQPAVDERTVASPSERRDRSELELPVRGGEDVLVYQLDLSSEDAGAFATSTRTDAGTTTRTRSQSACTITVFAVCSGGTPTARASSSAESVCGRGTSSKLSFARESRSISGTAASVSAPRGICFLRGALRRPCERSSEKPRRQSAAEYGCFGFSREGSSGDSRMRFRPGRRTISVARIYMDRRSAAMNSLHEEIERRIEELEIAISEHYQVVLAAEEQIRAAEETVRRVRKALDEARGSGGELRHARCAGAVVIAPTAFGGAHSKRVPSSDDDAERTPPGPLIELARARRRRRFSRSR
jgi:hypothetical protein